MGQQETQQPSAEETVGAVLCAMVWLLLVGGFVWVMVVSIGRITPYRDPEFMVSITGVDGLNPNPVPESAATATTMSPVFNLTVGVANRNTGNVYSSDDACVSGLSTAAVSYGDAFLGRGSVPPFCAEENTTAERAATAWGEDVVLPRFLRERLGAELQRGEAALDVQVTMPALACSACNDKVLVCSKVKIRGSSPSPCRVEMVRPMQDPQPPVKTY